MDADSGAILYGKNIDTAYYPASITKILTALIVIENCNPDDSLTFSHRAVYDVESGSSSAGYDEGDTITVRDALYAMLLKSANEAANALAEHTAGSIEAFADMMNDKAKMLGCTNSHFANPSGLNDENHYTTARDYALISAAAFRNQTLVEIISTRYYTLSPYKAYPEGVTIYAHHQMLLPNSSWYDKSVIGGKTGYTMLAGNTLVTCAEKNGMRLVTVILNGHQTHYSDTRLLLDYGFDNFYDISLDGDISSAYDIVSDDGIDGLTRDVLTIDNNSKVTLPQDAELSDTTTEVSFEIDASAPSDTIASIIYKYGDISIGRAYIKVDKDRLAKLKEEAGIGISDNTDDLSLRSKIHIPNPLSALSIPLQIIIYLMILAAMIYGIYILICKITEARDARELAKHREARRKRRIDAGYNSMDIVNDASASVHTYGDADFDKAHKKKGLFG